MDPHTEPLDGWLSERSVPFGDTTATPVTSLCRVGCEEAVSDSDILAQVDAAKNEVRRTLAWHIARRPGGMVALAIQYRHLETAPASEGYASRSRGGIHDLIDMETVRAVADTLAQLHDHLADGSGISGPAARRPIKAAAHTPRFEGTIVNATTARRPLADDDALSTTSCCATTSASRRYATVTFPPGRPAWTTACPAAATSSVPTSTPQHSATARPSSTSRPPTYPGRPVNACTATRTGCVPSPTPTTTPRTTLQDVAP